ncbi:DUF6296 family protein [Kitasatospora terrestris]|uniref:Uncharacterized protein n=1 Tax=Kitasatospora terrestris TaxID=258051 RepID=A0ABP9EQE5_9ACTN
MMTEPAVRYAVVLPSNGAGHGEAQVVVVCRLGVAGPNGGWLYADAQALFRVEILGDTARRIGPDGRAVDGMLWHAVPLPDRSRW